VSFNSAVSEFQDRVRPAIESTLDSGEPLLGICAATQQSTFKGRLVALAITDRRLILQPLSRKLERDGPVASILPEEISSAEAEGTSGGWWTPTSGITDKTALTLKLKTTDGEKRKLMMMRGDGPGPLGKLAGGEGQRQGVEALAAWFAARADAQA
jgi:hypothetical protein